MKIVFLGTGDAFCNDGRANTSVLVDAEYRILLDCSPQAVYNLRRLGYRVADLSFILLSHLHGDHAGGLPFIVLTLKFRESGRIVVTGPKDTETFAKKIYSAYYATGDASDVLEFRSLDSSFPFELSYLTAKHTTEAFVYRIRLEGKTIVYSGDTAPLDLSKFAQNAEILIHEASETSEQRAEQFGHTTPLQAAKVASDAHVGRLALVHRPHIDDDTRRRVLAVFPNTVLPNDLDEIVL